MVTVFGVFGFLDKVQSRAIPRSRQLSVKRRREFDEQVEKARFAVNFTASSEICAC